MMQCVLSQLQSWQSLATLVPAQIFRSEVEMYFVGVLVGILYFVTLDRYDHPCVCKFSVFEFFFVSWIYVQCCGSSYSFLGLGRLILFLFDK